MRGVAVGAEADTAACETVHVLERGVSARFPSPVNPKGSLARVDVTRAIGSGSVATMPTVAADKAVKAGFNRGHGVFRFAQNPDL